MVAGALLILFGTLGAEWIDGLPFAFKGTAKSIVSIGGAVLGAGVFSAILKSAQFVEIFQDHIHAVFYRPDSAIGFEENKRRWKVLTDSIFSKRLTRIHSEATEKLSEAFFTTDLDYHFENMEVNYRLELVGGRVLKVRVRTKSLIVVAPEAKPVIWHRLNTDNNDAARLISLIVNEDKVECDEMFKVDPKNPEQLLFELPYAHYSQFDSFKDSRSFTLERTMEFTQDLFKEPYVTASLSRFVSGFSVGIKAVDCNVHFAGTGMSLFDTPDPVEDGSGYRRWIMAKKGSLLLPGQGYIIIITS